MALFSEPLIQGNFTNKEKLLLRRVPRCCSRGTRPLRGHRAGLEAWRVPGRGGEDEADGGGRGRGGPSADRAPRTSASGRTARGVGVVSILC